MSSFSGGSFFGHSFSSSGGGFFGHSHSSGHHRHYGPSGHHRHYSRRRGCGCLGCMGAITIGMVALGGSIFGVLSLFG